VISRPAPASPADRPSYIDNTASDQFTDDNHQGVKALPVYRRTNGTVERAGNFDIGTGLS
jgi:hypothetical protein